MEGLWDGRVERTESLCSSRTPMKTSRLWVPPTHYPVAARAGSPGTSRSKSPFVYSGLAPRPSLPSSASAAFQPPSLMVGPLCDPCDCFSTLFTAADHSAIKGDLGYSIGSSHTVPGAPLAHHSYAKRLRDDFSKKPCAGGEKKQPGLPSLRIPTMTLIDGFFQKRTAGKRVELCQIIFIEDTATGGHDLAVI